MSYILKYSKNILIIIILLFLFSCNSNDVNNEQKNKNNKIDSLLLTLDSLHHANVDSAIKFAEIINMEIIQSQNTVQIVNFLSFLTEVYQYRLPNDAKALNYASKILERMALYPDVSYDNPFVFINIGNILLKNDFIDEAIEMYFYALEIPMDNKFTFALIYNNIASSYLRQENCELSKN